MKPELQIKALAELDGWTQLHWRHGTIHGVLAGTPPDFRMDVAYVPNYLTSYDAIIPLIQKQSTNVINAMRTWLVGNIPLRLPFFVWLFATPAQLCEALLRATGKWIE